MKINRRQSRKARIEMVPLVDMFFLVLVFFFPPCCPWPSVVPCRSNCRSPPPPSLIEKVSCPLQSSPTDLFFWITTPISLELTSRGFDQQERKTG